MPNLSTRLLSLAGFSLLGALGCGSGDEGGSSTPSTSTGDPPGVGGAGVQSGGLIIGAGEGPGIDPNRQGAAGSTSGGGLNPAECGGSTYQGESRPLDMYIMMDRSSSMVGFGSLSGGGNLWDPVGQAIGTFVTLPETTGIAAGIAFFPPHDAAIECDINFYATPVVPIAPLPPNAPLIQQAIVDHIPGNGLNGIGFTPTLPAMLGAVQQAQAHAAANPGNKTIIVLITDGEPNNCNSNIPDVAGTAYSGLSGSPPVETYVIGIGNVPGLDEIAAAGGSGQAIQVSADPALAAQEFLDAMNVVRGAALPCDYAIPEVERGDFNASKVNLNFTTGTSDEIIGQVPDETACDPALGGWYYDNPASPTRIFACPASCDGFKINTQAKVEVIVGCDTQVLIK